MLRRSARFSSMWGKATSPRSFAFIKLNTSDICVRNTGITDYGSDRWTVWTVFHPEFLGNFAPTWRRLSNKLFIGRLVFAWWFFFFFLSEWDFAVASHEPLIRTCKCSYNSLMFCFGFFFLRNCGLSDSWMDTIRLLYSCELSYLPACTCNIFIYFFWWLLSPSGHWALSHRIVAGLSVNDTQIHTKESAAPRCNISPFVNYLTGL